MNANLTWFVSCWIYFFNSVILILCYLEGFHFAVKFCLFLHLKFTSSNLAIPNWYAYKEHCKSFGLGLYNTPPTPGSNSFSFFTIWCAIHNFFPPIRPQFSLKLSTFIFLPAVQVGDLCLHVLNSVKCFRMTRCTKWAQLIWNQKEARHTREKIMFLP